MIDQSSAASSLLFSRLSSCFHIFFTLFFAMAAYLSNEWRELLSEAAFEKRQEPAY
jgi:hypothetical protein